MLLPSILGDPQDSGSPRSSARLRPGVTSATDVTRCMMRDAHTTMNDGCMLYDDDDDDDNDDDDDDDDARRTTPHPILTLCHYETYSIHNDITIRALD